MTRSVCMTWGLNDIPAYVRCSKFQCVTMSYKAPHYALYHEAFVQLFSQLQRFKPKQGLKKRNNKVFYLFTSTISLITVRYPFEWSLRLRFFCMIKVPFDTFVVKFHTYSLLSVVFVETSNYFFIRFSASKRQHSQTLSPDCVHLKTLIR